MPRNFFCTTHIRIHPTDDPERTLSDLNISGNYSCREAWIEDIWSGIDRNTLVSSRIQSINPSLSGMYLLFNTRQLRVAVDGWQFCDPRCAPLFREIAQVFRIRHRTSAVTERTSSVFGEMNDSGHKVMFTSRGSSSIAALWWAALINRIYVSEDFRECPASVLDCLQRSEGGIGSQYYNSGDRPRMIAYWERTLNNQHLDARKWIGTYGPIGADNMRANHSTWNRSIRRLERTHDIAAALFPGR